MDTTGKKQLIWLIVACLLFIYFYSMVHELAKALGTQKLRELFNQGGFMGACRQMPWGKALSSAARQWLLLALIIAFSGWGRPYFERFSQLLLAVPRPYFLLGVVGMAFAIHLGIFYCKYMFFPRSGDSHAYLFQARVLLKGRLSIPSHPLREFFDSDWIINNGRMYAQYTLGNSIMLALGYLVGAPWLVNPLLAALALIFIYRSALELFGEQIARYSVLLLLATPLYHVELPSSYLSHAPTLFFLSIFVYYFIRSCRQGDRPWQALAAGAALGMAFNTRPMTALCASLPLLAWAGYSSLRDWRVFSRRWLFFFLGVLPFILLFLGANWAQNGSPFVSGYSVYNNNALLDLSKQRYSPTKAILTLLFRLYLLAGLLARYPLSGGMILFVIALTFIRFKPVYLFLWAAFLVTCLGYLPAATAVWQYRYYYTPAIFLLFLLPLGLYWLGDWLRENFHFSSASSLLSAFLLAGVLCSSAAAYRQGVKPYPWMLVFKRPHDTAQRANLQNALVFIREVEYFYPRWYCRNFPDFDKAPIIWALDLGDEYNRKLLDYYPKRHAYLYIKGKLVPYGR